MGLEFLRPLLAAALLVGTAAGARAADIDAVASFSILADMVAHIGGEHVAVTALIGRDADAHAYQPTPGDAAAVAGADIVFVNGLGFEGWLDRLVGAAEYEGPVVTASTGVATGVMEEDGAPVTDPHAWQDLANGDIYVRNIAAGLCTVDASGCPYYTAKAEAYGARIAALDAEVAAAIAAVPEAQRRVITSHDAFGYLGRRYGVEFVAPQGISTDSEASAADVARLIDQIRADGITALFIENMSDPRLLAQIAAETGAKVGGTLYSDALSSADGPASTYLEMFRHNADLLVPAMLGNPQ